MLQVSRHRSFFCEYCEIFKNAYFEKHMQTALFKYASDVETFFNVKYVFSKTDSESKFLMKVSWNESRQLIQRRL